MVSCICCISCFWPSIWFFKAAKLAFAVARSAPTACNCFAASARLAACVLMVALRSARVSAWLCRLVFSVPASISAWLALAYARVASCFAAAAAALASSLCSLAALTSICWADVRISRADFSVCKASYLACTSARSRARLLARSSPTLALRSASWCCCRRRSCSAGSMPPAVADFLKRMASSKPTITTPIRIKTIISIGAKLVSV